MPSKTIQLEIKTSDESLFSDLKAENIQDLKLSQRIFTCDSADWIPPTVKVLTIIVSTSKEISLALLSAWLYDRFKNKQPEKASINGTDIVDDPKKIAVIINVCIQEIRNSEANQKPKDNPF
jgi:hypothetical protein